MKQEETKVKPAKKAVKRTRKETIDLEDLWNQTEQDEVKLYQLSKKLTGLVTTEEKKRLNPQDLKDLKEI